MEPAAVAAVMAVALYVFHASLTSPAPTVVELREGNYRVDHLRPYVTAAVKKVAEAFSDLQLNSGSLSVVDEPEGVPALSTGHPLKPTATISIVAGKCIVLDLGSCESSVNKLHPTPHAAPTPRPPQPRHSPARLRTPPSRPRPSPAGLPGGAGAAAAAGGGAADLAAEFRAFRLETTTKLDTVIKQSKEISGVFSGASQTDAMNFARDENIRQGGRLELPALASCAVSPVPYTWGGRSETQASRTLRDSLQAWTCEGASPPINVCFLNTENLTRAPLVAAHEGATYTGVPDLVTLLPGLGVDTVTVFQSASSSWDWKTEKKFTEKRSAVAGQAVLQLLAFSRLTIDGCTVPVFFTDMSTGVRCWIMVDKVVYTFHGDGGGPNDLSLERGILLLRYFIANNGRLSAADKARLVPQSASGSGGAAGGGAGSAAASGSGPSDKPEGGAPLSPADDPAGGSGSAAGAGMTRSATLAVSQLSSPDDPAVLRAEHRAMFELELVVAASTLRACCVDLSGVVDF